jgi:hypothetical protein
MKMVARTLSDRPQLASSEDHKHGSRAFLLLL